MLENKIRDLAKRVDSQNSFAATKEILSFRLFNNDTDLSRLQHLYLSYLFFYYYLHLDISIGKVKEIVLTDAIYEDAYFVYKNHKQPELKDTVNQSGNINLVFNEKRHDKRGK